jgi:16S rRNA (guanine(966)-N(2))-methyltransferase RsmD
MLRLTGGEFRGRLIKTPKDLTTRPTQARLRQALFNAIQFHIQDSVVLDLFAGSGALGFEALSRGAERVVFVETSKPALKMLSENIAELKVRDRAIVISEPVEASSSLLLRSAPFQIVLADPPYSEGWEDKILGDLPWGELLSPEGLLILEWGRLKSQVKELPEKTPFLVKTREKIYGESILSTFKRAV